MILIDDSTNDTSWMIQQAAAGSTPPVRLPRWLPQERTGGLSGAVAEVILASFNRWMLRNIVAVATLKRASEAHVEAGQAQLLVDS